MPLNPILGAGREAQSRGAIANYRIKQDSVGLGVNANFPGNIETIDLNSGERVFSIQVKLFPTSTGSSIDSARFRIRINQYVIADYKLPNNDAWLDNIEETIPVDVLIDGAYQLIVEYGPELADATGYNIGFSVTAYTITY